MIEFKIRTGRSYWSRCDQEQMKGSMANVEGGQKGYFQSAPDWDAQVEVGYAGELPAIRNLAAELFPLAGAADAVAAVIDTLEAASETMTEETK